VHGNGTPNGNGNPVGMGIKHGIGDGNGKPTQWDWELPALPWEFIPTDFRRKCGQFSIIETVGL